MGLIKKIVFGDVLQLGIHNLKNARKLKLKLKKKSPSCMRLSTCDAELRTQTNKHSYLFKYVFLWCGMVAVNKFLIANGTRQKP